MTLSESEMSVMEKNEGGWKVPEIEVRWVVLAVLFSKGGADLAGPGGPQTDGKAPSLILICILTAFD